MSVQARRVALLLATSACLALLLVACASTPTTSPSSGLSGGYVFSTPNPNAISPTPTFPPFTIAAWVSNYSPNPNDTVTIYVICKIQDPTMQTAGGPASGLTVTVNVGPPLNTTLTGVTGKAGIAAIPYSFNDPEVGTPVTLTVSANWQGQTYTNETWFTPGVTVPPTPGSATPSSTP
jgi:hypothetical protein